MEVEKLRKRAPHPPSSPPPKGRGKGGKKKGEEDGEESQTTCERLVAALALALCICIVGFTLRKVHRMLAVEDEIAGFTFEDRAKWLASLAWTEEDLILARDVRASATISFFLDDTSEKPSVKIQATSKGHKTHSPVKAFSQSTFFGIPGDYKLLEKDLKHSLKQFGSGKLFKCTFESPSFSWESEGACVQFPKDDVTENLEHIVQIVAQKNQQPAVFKWWPHVWGTDEEAHHTFMQAVKPSLATLALVKSHHPVYLV